MSVFLFLIVALIRSTTIVPGDLQNLSPFQSTHSQGVRPLQIDPEEGGLSISIHALTRSAT